MENTFFRSVFMVATMVAVVACTPDMVSDQAGEPVGVQARIMGFDGHNDDWNVGDTIGVSIPSVNNNYNVAYCIGNDGVFTPVASPVYMVGTKAHQLVAYYPYQSEATQSAPTVLFDDAVDWLWADTTLSREDLQVALEFHHVMSRLTILFSEEVNYSAYGIAASGSFHTGTGVVTASSMPTEVSGQGKQLSVLVPPQQVSGSIAAVWGERTFLISLNTTLEAGKSYTFRAQLTEETEAIQLENITGSIVPWEEVDGGNVVVTEKEPDLAVGDYYLSDGTTISHLRTLTAAQKAQVIGIVCELGSNTDDSTRLADFPACTTAKVIALYDATARAWNTETVSTTMCAWMINNGLESQYLWPARYKKDLTADGMISTSASAGRDNVCQGYNNTKLWKQYAGSATTYTVLSTLGSMAAPEGTTGWYVASIGDLSALLVDASINPTVQASLTALGVALPYEQTLWTSSESRLEGGSQASMTVKIKGADGSASIGQGRAVHTKAYPVVYMLCY